MEKPLKGDVIVIPFPFSDLSSSKRRPALVIADTEGDDVILCQITSIARHDKYAILLSDSDFSKGKLEFNSYIRPNKIFTADKSIIIRRIGNIRDQKRKEVIRCITRILEG